MNPIENLWAIIKKRLQKFDCTTMFKLISAVIQVWCHDDKLKQICETLVRSMPKRIEAVIKNRGGHTKY